jgi:tetratricopeptide (TPR) repeat protein
MARARRRTIKRTARNEALKQAAPAPAHPSAPRAAPGKGRLLALLLVLITGAGLYLHTLPFPMQFDDEMYLTNNPLVQDSGSFLYPARFQEFMKTARHRGFSDDLTVNFVLRPIAYLSFHVNWLLGGFATPGFRAVNIAIHCANGVLVFLLASLLLRHSRRAGTEPDARPQIFIPAVAALAFAAHPLQIESVTYIVQRFTSMGAFLFLGALVSHLLSCTAATRRADLAWRACGVAAVLAGMLTKEIVFTAPLALVLMDVLVLGAAWKTALKRALPALALLPLIPFIVWLAHATLTDGSSTLGEAMRIVQFNTTEGYQTRYLITQVPVILSYLRLLLLPAGQNVDPHVPLASSWLEMRVILSGLALLVISALPFAAWARQRASLPRALVLFGVAWFFLTISVSSSIVPLPDLMAEHHTYLPSVGIFLALAVLLDRARAALHPAGRRFTFAHGFAALWIIALSAATVARNEAWRTELALWQDTAQKSPNKSRVLGNLAVILHNSGRSDEAEPLLRRAVTCGDVAIHVYSNLAHLLNLKQRYAESLPVSEHALKISPNSASLHFNRGISLCNLGKMDEGRAALQRAIQISPNHADSHVALGHMYMLLRQPASARPHLERALALGVRDQRIVALHQQSLSAGDEPSAE